MFLPGLTLILSIVPDYFLTTVSTKAKSLTGNSRLIAIYDKIATVYYGV